MKNMITTIGLDLAKSVFQVHGIDADGQVVVRRKLSRSRLLNYFAKLRPCLVGMEACATAHYWARKIAAKGRMGVAAVLKVLADPSDKRVPALARQCLKSLAKELMHVKHDILEMDRKIMKVHRASAVSKRLETIPGVGPVIATRVAAEVANPGSFKSGRAFSAWIGLVPRQHSSGGRDRLGHITKTGHPQLRRLLVAGAMSMIIRAKRDGFTRHPWLVRLLQRKPTKIAAVALANKLARMIWALMMHGKTFDPARLKPAMAS